MDISFIIPARNEERHLALTIQSIKRSLARASFEIIIVDDCSSLPVSGLGLSPEIIILRNEERLGVSRSRNRGAAPARGDVLMFLDAHVAFTPALFREWHPIVRDKRIIAGIPYQRASSFEYFRRAATHLSAPDAENREIVYGYHLALSPAIDIAPITSPPASAFPAVPIVGAYGLMIDRSYFLELGEFFEGFTGFGALEDTELCMRCWLLGGEVVTDASRLLVHHSQADCERDPAGRLAKYDGGYENSLKLALMYFESHPEIKQALEDKYSAVGGTLRGSSVAITPELLRHRALIESKRVYSSDWLLARLGELPGDPIL